ncbi:MAG TPA: hypothetical protein VHQ47_15770, partial [Phycisphaerae bacterium]|nr:hypothetical protein [Phycisphaerae bacterium]
WSILRVLGREQWVARRAEEYVEIAVRLAGDLAGLAEERRTLRERMRGSALTDVGAFARDIEGAYRGLWREWCE